MEVNSNRIFFCYDTMDKEVVAEFYQMLKDEGFNPWMAGVDILVGQNRNRRKRIALKSSKLVVVFFSKNSVSDKGDIQSELKFVFDILKEVSEDETCIIPIRLDECAIPDELQHIEYVDLIDKSGYEKTIKSVQSKFKSYADSSVKIKSLDSSPIEKSDNTLNRGEVIESFIDGVIYSHKDVTRLNSLVHKKVHLDEVLPCHTYYITDSGSKFWLELSNDKTYTLLIDSINFLKSNIDKIISCLEKNSPKEAPDFISLGPGNGKKDRIILKSLKKAIQNFTNENIYYYPLDVSNKMLAQAIKTIRCEKDIEKGLLIKAVIGDFYDLPDFKELFDNRLNYNLFSFLGNTLGNVENERTLLNRIKKGMDEVDSLLLEVRLAPESEVELSIGGNKQVRNRFYYEPIARAYGIPSSKPKVFYEEHTNLSVINKTRTLVGFCRESIQGKEKLQKLTYIHHYDKKEFVSFLRDDMKFKIIESFTNDEIIYFLLKK